MRETSPSMTHTPVSRGPVVQSEYSLADVGLASTGTPTAPIMANGYKNVAVGLQTTVAGTLTMQRYLDQAATVPQGAPLTLALTANAAGTLNANDGAGFQSFTLSLSGGGAISNFDILLSAA